MSHTYETQNTTGWWLKNPSEKYEFVNWDDEIPNISGKIKHGNQTTNQIPIDIASTRVPLEILVPAITRSFWLRITSLPMPRENHKQLLNRCSSIHIYDSTGTQPIKPHQTSSNWQCAWHHGTQP